MGKKVDVRKSKRYEKEVVKKVSSPQKLFKMMKGYMEKEYVVVVEPEIKEGKEGFQGYKLEVYKEKDRGYPYEVNSISVDASSLNNPGLTEYQGVDTGTGEKLFVSKKYKEGTNNIGEFLALVEAMKYLEDKGLDIPIYTDSMTALAWVRNHKVNTELKVTDNTKELFEDVDKAVEYLKRTKRKADIRKWDTKKWGESKADFGRK